LLLEMQLKLWTQVLYSGLPENLGRLLYTDQYPVSGPDEVGG